MKVRECGLCACAIIVLCGVCGVRFVLSCAFRAFRGLRDFCVYSLCLRACVARVLSP